MKACINAGKGAYCAVQTTGREGLKAVSTTWCGAKANAADGVIQLPDDHLIHDACEKAIEAFEKKMPRRPVTATPPTSPGATST